MRKLTFTIELTFEDSINLDRDIKKVGQNIADAIERESKNYGITPEESETYLKNVKVSNEKVGQCANFNIIE